MTSKTKERLLNDLEALRYQLSELEAYGNADAPTMPDMAAIPTLEIDNIPLLSNAVPADRDEAIAAHKAAMVTLNKELKALDTTAVPSPLSEPPLISDQISPVQVPRYPTDTATRQTFREDTTASTTAIAANNSMPADPAITDLVQPTKKQAVVKNPIAPAAMPIMPHTPKPASNNDDNPFLPQHLRERLSQSKNSLLEGILKSSESVDASTALLRNFSGAEPTKSYTPKLGNNPHQAIIDSLVAKYLPLIEADLRHRLAESLQPKTSNNHYNMGANKTTPELQL